MNWLSKLTILLALLGPAACGDDDDDDTAADGDADSDSDSDSDSDADSDSDSDSDSDADGDGDGDGDADADADGDADADADTDADGDADCLGEGESGAVVPGALPCCEGLVNIGCEQPSADGACPEGCAGAYYCAACGTDDACGPGENICNCPADCGR